MKQITLCLIHDEEGATAVEYALMVALIAVVIIVAVGLLGGELGRLFNAVGDIIGGEYTKASEQIGG